MFLRDPNSSITNIQEALCPTLKVPPLRLIVLQGILVCEELHGLVHLDMVTLLSLLASGCTLRVCDFADRLHAYKAT